jgi:hypothetical protein
MQKTKIITYFEKVQVCFATSINYFCDCKAIAKLQAATKQSMSDTRYKHTHPTGEYIVNNKSFW